MNLPHQRPIFMILTLNGFHHHTALSPSLPSTFQMFFNCFIDFLFFSISLHFLYYFIFYTLSNYFVVKIKVDLYTNDPVQACFMYHLFKGEVHTRKSFSRDVLFRKSFKNDDEQKKPQVKSSFRSRDIDDSLFSIVTSLGSEGKFQNINFMTTRRSTSYFPNKKSNLLQTFTDN